MKLGKITEKKERDWRNELEIVRDIELSDEDVEAVKKWYSTTVCGCLPRKVEMRVAIFYDTAKKEIAWLYYEEETTLNLGGKMGWIKFPEDLVYDEVKKEIYSTDYEELRKEA